MQQTMTSYGPCEGNLALKPKAPRHARFVVLEGGRGKSASADCRVSEAPRAQNVRFLALGAALIVALLAGALVFSQNLQASRRQQAFSQAPLESYTVSTGDSLWSLAESHPVKGATTQEVASYIKQANHLGSSELLAGQQVEVPQAS